MIKEEIIRYSHDVTFDCGNAEYAAVMYGIHQGSKNNGERLTAKQTLKLTNSMLEYTVSNNTGKDLFVSKFYIKTGYFRHT